MIALTEKEGQCFVNEYRADVDEESFVRICPLFEFEVQEYRATVTAW